MRTAVSRPGVSPRLWRGVGTCLVLYAALLAILFSLGCAPKPPDLASRPPDVQRAFQASDFLTAVDVLSRTAITLNDRGILTLALTREVRDFARGATAAARAYVPGGSMAATTTALGVLKAHLTGPGALPADLAAAVYTLEKILEGVR